MDKGDNMNDVRKYVGKIVNIECVDGREYNNYYVDCFTSAYDNYEPNEDSIDILESKGDTDGITLYCSEIGSIEIIDQL